MPEGVFDLLAERLATLTANSTQNLTLGLAVSTAIAMWTGSRGVNAVIDLLNLSYHEAVPRSFFRRFAAALGMTIGALIGLIVILLTVAALPLVLQNLPIDAEVERLTLWARWPILGAFIFAGILLLYRFGPNRRPAKWRWLIPGALTTTLLWIALSAAFSAYVERSDFYGATFGTVSVAAVLMLWIYYSALVVGIGAIINAEIEVQTRKDSTRGRSRERGQRGAIVADRLPRLRPKRQDR
jgi:membrane protein